MAVLQPKDRLGAVTWETLMKQLRAIGWGFYIGLWLGALGTSVYALWYVTSHSYQGELDGPWPFYLWLSFGPIWMFMLRFWKWVFTFALAALGWHELHKLEKTVRLITEVALVYTASQPDNRQRLARYGRWLTKSSQDDPGRLVPADRFVLWASCILGLSLYCFTAFSTYPQHTRFSNNAVVPEPGPKVQSYSQNTLVIHNGSEDPTQMTGQSNAQNSVESTQP